jgi:1-acylglycerone phosphate reductase
LDNSTHVLTALDDGVESETFSSPVPWGGIYAATKSAVQSITNTLEMECRPFNIKVLLVSPGGVSSNLSANQSYNPAPNSLYTKYTEKILARLNLSQSSPMATDIFAKQVVRKALASKPPSYMTLGSGSTFFWLLSWLPRAWVLSLLWNRFGKAS